MARSKNFSDSVLADDETPLPIPEHVRKKILWIAATAGWVVLVVSLATFHSADWPTHVVANPNIPPVNLCGRFGAAIAYWSYHSLGFGVWIPTLFLGTWLGFAAAGREITHAGTRAIGALLMMLAFSALHAQWFPDVGTLGGAAAGLIPTFFTAELGARFGPVGASILLMTALLLGAVVTADQIVARIPSAIRSALSFLEPVFKADWSGHFESIKMRVAQMFPQPQVAGGASPSASKPARTRVSALATSVTTATTTPTASAIADIDQDDAEQIAQSTEDACEEIAHNKRVPLSDEELRSRISMLPVKIASSTEHLALRDEDIPRTVDYSGYQFPTLDLLEEAEGNYSTKLETFVRDQATVLINALREYKIEGEITQIESGPVVTVYSVELAPGTLVSKLERVSVDIARSLRAPNIRIITNMVGRTAVGIEVPNQHKEKVRLKELMSSGHAAGMTLPMFLGKDSAGEPLVLDLVKMPHMLIAGTTGSGKSVCMNTIIMSWLYTKRPDELKLVLVDPKMVEMAQFSEVPHLACPVITEMSKAAAVLEWAVLKMDERYELLKEVGVQNIASFNALGEEELKTRVAPENDLEWAKFPKKMHYMVFVIDELADLMMTNKEVEHSIVRIAQKARAVGIHLVLATQRPQASVVTGLIKSNMPCRIGFKVASSMDSRIVLDQKGAELLLGQGDMLVVTPSQTDARRCQGTFVTDGETRKVARFLKDVAMPTFERQLMTLRALSKDADGEGEADIASGEAERDSLFDKAVEVMIDSGRGSVSLLQRRLAIGYGRASRLVDQMGAAGILSDHKGSVAREVLISVDDWQRMKSMRDAGEREGTVFATERDGAVLSTASTRGVSANSSFTPSASASKTNDADSEGAHWADDINDEED
ncbi:MAG: DNA translocase FtsK [Phycisphaerales bacterium]|nr:DNA translocase FtsK [Phycisphaerales bacterium]